MLSISIVLSQSNEACQCKIECSRYVPSFTHKRSTGAFQQLLFWKLKKPSCFYRIDAFNYTNRSKSPARSTFPLSSYRIHHSLKSPVNWFWNVVRIILFICFYKRMFFFGAVSCSIAITLLTENFIVNYFIS